MIEKLVPEIIYERFIQRAKLRIRDERRRRELELPKVPLQKKHIEDCTVVLNRIELLGELHPSSTVAEIGVAEGDFSESILAKNNPRKLHLIDIWNSKRYGETEYQRVTNRFSAEMDQGTVDVHRTLSTEAVDTFEDNYFDWIYIDTNHTYETTLEELKLYKPKIKRNGFIAGHDYTVGNWSEGLRYGVIEAVHEFCVDYEWRIAYLTADPIENRSFAIQRI
jgi:cephalosporin hydroxylase